MNNESDDKPKPLVAPKLRTDDDYTAGEFSCLDDPEFDPERFDASAQNSAPSSPRKTRKN